MFPVGDDAGGRVEEGLAPQECGQRFAGVGAAAMQVAVSARQQPEAPGDGMAVGGDQSGHGMVGIEHAVLGQRLYGLEAAAHGIALGTRERQKMLDGIAPGADTQPADPAPESMAVIFGNAMFERPCRRPRCTYMGPDAQVRSDRHRHDDRPSPRRSADTQHHRP